MQQKIENGTVNANRIDLQNYVVQLNTDDLIELAETGKTGNIELDSMAATVFRDCSNMLEFEADYYEREEKRNAR
ncbi:hypothetical protein [Ligilactobacillus aviarius]|uniref:hypothetical protein n=1 Tax=Ligilactobacillus aviarius TaxID=1606 RepID=UPI00242EBBC4|nr:hypothetical protein [Ligilactobacillus aviarius]